MFVRAQELAPEYGTERPNPEYPWETSVGVAVPAEYPFRELDPRFSHQTRKLLDFLRRCTEY